MNDFIITKDDVTEVAQKLHNEIDTNGSISERQILEIMTEHYAELFADWAELHIDWQKIEDDDLDAREFVAEREEAAKGDY